VAAVKQGKRWSFIDREGRTVIPARFEEAFAFRKGLAQVRSGHGWMMINHSGVSAIKKKIDRPRFNGAEMLMNMYLEGSL
jgi:hypothetical protein